LSGGRQLSFDLVGSGKRVAAPVEQLVRGPDGMIDDTQWLLSAWNGDGRSHPLTAAERERMAAAVMDLRERKRRRPVAPQIERRTIAPLRKHRMVDQAGPMVAG
jgi:hypothetical protein